MDSTVRSDKYRNGRSQSWLDIDSRDCVSTRNIFFTSWTLAALFDYPLRNQGENSVVDASRSPLVRASDTRLKKFARHLSLTRAQQKSIDIATSRLQPLIVSYREEIEEQRRALTALDPLADGYVVEVAKTCGRIGTLATQQSLTTCKLKADIHGILSAEQRSIISEFGDELQRLPFCFTKLREKWPGRDTTCQPGA